MEKVEKICNLHICLHNQRNPCVVSKKQAKATDDTFATLLHNKISKSHNSQN